MEIIINYFNQIPSSHRAAILVSGIVIFWLVENQIPLFNFKYKKWQHAGVNFFFTLTTIVVNFPLAIALVWAANWTAQVHFGLFYWLDSLPFTVQWLLALMMLDFVGAWLAHWIQHKVKFLWRFHIIHHVDQQVDTTTANRHHPGESVIRFIFTFFAILISGAPIWLVFLYQSLSVILSQFNHANIILPKWLDKPIGWLIVTPNIHHIHHHYLQPYTDSNYGNIFSVWDRIFGTFMFKEQKTLRYGLDTHLHPKELANISNLLKLPFLANKVTSKDQ